MNNEDLQQLKALALAATAGPWGCFSNEEDGDITSHDVIAINSGVHIASEDHLPSEETARYIAAASPDVVLALIARIESLATDAKDAERWRKHLSMMIENGHRVREIGATIDAVDAAIAKEKA